MSESVGELRIDVTVQLAQMQAQFDDMQRRTRALNNKVNSEFQFMARGIKAAMSSIGVLLAPAAVIGFTKSVVDLGSQITDLSAAANISTDSFQALSVHFMDSGVNMQELSKALVMLRKNTQEAVSGNKQMADSFAALGLNPARLQSLALERQLEVLGLSIATAADKNAAFNAALDILGSKGAPKLLAALKELGVEGFDKVAASAEKFKLRPDQLKSIDDLGDKLARVWDYMLKIGAKAVASAAVIGGDVLGGFTNTAADYAKASDPPTAPELSKGQKDLLASVSATTSSHSANRDFDKGLTAEQEAKGMRAVRDAIDKQNAEMEKLAQTYRDMLDPTLAFKRQMDEVRQAEQAGTLSAEEAARAIVMLKDAMAKDEGARVNAALNDFFGPLDQMQKKLNSAAKISAESARELGSAFSSAFEDAILGGKGFSEVLKGLGRDILALILRKTIVSPLVNGLMTILGFADGGDPPVGVPSLVGERGPELFVPKAAGTIIPNHALSGGGSRGAVYNIDARGADRTGLSRLESMIKTLNGSIEKRSVAAMFDARRRSPSAA